jgi:hypothetical protein
MYGNGRVENFSQKLHRLLSKREIFSILKTHQLTSGRLNEEKTWK